MTDPEPLVFDGSVEFGHRVGTPIVMWSVAHGEAWSTVFEDDGATGYLYGVRGRSDVDWEIVDGLHVYTVEQVVDQEAVYPMEIRWADDANVVGLFIEGKCHAVYDFDRRHAACRDNFPDAAGFGFTDTHEWDEALGQGLGPLE